MAHQLGLSRGKSWSTGSATGSFPSSSAAQLVKSERLKKLDQDVKTNSSDMEVLEAEIRDLSTTLARLKKFDAKRVERLTELADDGEVDDNVGAKNFHNRDGKGLNGGEQEGERSSEGEANEEVETLRSEHEVSQRQIQYTEASLEKKRAELEALSEKHQTLTDLISKEEKHVSAAEIDESFQETVDVQLEMRSLPEDLGRMGRVTVGLKEANTDPLKQSLTRPQQKPRMYHPVTQLRSRSLYRISQNGSGSVVSDLGRSASVGDAPMGTSRTKEPIRTKESSRIKAAAGFGEREGGGNRKRQKSTSFELERGKFHEERAKLEMEAKEKRMLLDSLASFSSQPQPQRSKEAPAARASSPSTRDISSPSSVFEGFGGTPLDPASSGSTVLMSDSSESSSEYSTEKLDPNSISSAVKRLDFESLAKEDSPSSEAIAPSPMDTPTKPSYAEILNRTSVEGNVDIGREESGDQQKASSIETGEECLSSENGNDEFQVPAGTSTDNTVEEILGTEGMSPVSGIEGMQGPEMLSSEVEGKRESEVLISQTAAEEEIEDPVSDVVNFQQGVLESFSEGLGSPEGEIDSKRTLEEGESNSPRGLDEVEEIDIPTEEFDSLRDAGGAGEEQNFREEEVITARNTVEEIEVPEEEIEVPEEDIEDFGDLEHADETSEQEIPQKETGIDNGEIPVETESEVCAHDNGEDEAIDVRQSTSAQAPELPENGFKSSEPAISGFQSPPHAGHLNHEEMTGERNNRRLEAENQMMQLSSQLSLLQKQVEEEVELHEKAKTDSQQEHTFVEKEQLSKQVSFFADEVRGLRQNIDEIQGILHKEGELPVVEHWAKDLHSKCADQSAQLEHLGKQVSMLGNYLKHHVQLSVDIDMKLDKEAQERQKVETQLTDLSKALAMTVSTMEKEEEAMEEVIQHQKHLLVDQLKEAEKLRHIAEVRVLTLNNQIEQLEMVYDTAKSIQAVSKCQGKAIRYGLQALMQLFFLGLGVITLYSRVAEPFRGSLVPT